MNFELLPMETRWLDDVVRVERAAHSHPWAESLLRKPENKFDCHRVLVEAGTLKGYFFAQCVAGEATLLNIAVAPEYQGQGVGAQLLKAFLACMREAGAEEAWLEVRESNRAAITLYEKFEFNEFDRRINYYPTASGHEDALIMSHWFE
ncbi:ribosomal protein S18-alanine N-acetyltransferase [Enterovibrio nigricans]|uniref:[Ribosomal protein bS18]-alanine N-acetyltransferase n=1 Tax=Enterovibrio nigricans DSM 22720 TaxID=1121868 RepID=A0A1T4TSI4_9GAMM|nr:ribosomal protein S18-alanine N-acetyltransferase [Enterovibrio nigricans]PKF51884.1 ribosomal-protein-alanine N-acetyltransferase [Enterovibrio nigricans]SKA43377.1 ribosomal-protein-alanine N-acetyltransferase [Enterovibrio nigricans DSM 22720]